MTKLVIGVPISRKFDWRTNLAQIRAVIDAVSGGMGLEIVSAGNHERPIPITRARNEIAATAVEHGADWLFWLDSDATLAPGSLARLLSWGAPLVSALCFKRKYPVTPACGRKDPNPDASEWSHPAPIEDVLAWVAGHEGLGRLSGSVVLPDTEGALLDVDVIGTHATLVRRDVLDAFGPPWYIRTSPPDHGSTGSDWYFCREAQRAGFPVHVDMSVISGHLEGAHSISVYDFVAWTIATKYSDYINSSEGESK